jgi:type II secretory pathway pseudopilin PulG
MIAPSLSTFRHSSRALGFSIIELLGVVSIVGLLTIFSMIALAGSNQRVVGLEAATFASWVEHARTLAIAQGRPVRLCVAIDWPGNESAEYRAFSMWMQDEPGVWRQLRPWKGLNDHTVFSSAESDSTAGIQALSEGGAPLMEINAGDTGISTRYLEFQPTGHLANEFPGGPSFVLQRAGQLVKGDDWAEISIHPVTGKASIYRKEFDSAR